MSKTKKRKKGKGKKQKQSETAGSKLINKLALLRTKAKLSLRKLSQKSGIPVTALWRYERGEAPRVDVAFQIARALNRTVESVWPTATKGVKRSKQTKQTPTIKAKAKRKVKAKVRRVHKPTRKPKVKAQIRLKVVKAKPKRVRVRKPKASPPIPSAELEREVEETNHILNSSE